MAEQGERIALFSAEGGIFEMMAGRYSQGVPNLDVYLKGHAGDGLRVDRRSGPPVIISHPAITMGLAVQPDVLRGLADKPGFRGRGLIARFLYALPPNLMGRRRAGTPAVLAATVQQYRRCLLGLLETEPNAEGAIRLALSEDAAQSRLAFEGRLEPRLGPGGDLNHMGDWAGKAAGAAVRIAGVMHAVRCVDSAKPVGGAVEGESMRAAVDLVEHYFLPHALAALAEMGADPEIDKARRVLAWILGRDIHEFSLRDLHQGLRGQGCFRAVEGVAVSVKLLESHNYLRRLPDPPQRGPGHPPSPRYSVNPLALSQTQNPQNPQNEADAVLPEDCEDSEEDKPKGGGCP
jgi:hypothetical protein